MFDNIKRFVTLILIVNIIKFNFNNSMTIIPTNHYNFGTILMDINFILEAIENFAQTNSTISYLLLFICSFIENVFPPAPGDSVTVFGAFLGGRGKLEFFWVLFSTTAGSTFGFLFFYYLGYKLGRDYFVKKNFKYFTVEHIDSTTTWFNKYGYYIILGNRFLVGIRSVISIAAGIARMDQKKVITLCIISGLVWNSILIYFGYFLGENWKDIEFYLARYSQIVFGLIAITIIILIFRWWRGKKTA